MTVSNPGLAMQLDSWGDVQQFPSQLPWGSQLDCYRVEPYTWVAPPYPFLQLPPDILIRIMRFVEALYGVRTLQVLLLAFPLLVPFVVVISDDLRKRDLFSVPHVMTVPIHRYLKYLNLPEIKVFTFYNLDAALGDGFIVSRDSIYARHLKSDSMVVAKVNREHGVTAELFSWLMRRSDCDSQYTVVTDPKKLKEVVCTESAEIVLYEQDSVYHSTSHGAITMDARIDKNLKYPYFEATDEGIENLRVHFDGDLSREDDRMARDEPEVDLSGCYSLERLYVSFCTNKAPVIIQSPMTSHRNQLQEITLQNLRWFEMWPFGYLGGKYKRKGTDYKAHCFNCQSLNCLSTYRLNSPEFVLTGVRSMNFIGIPDLYLYKTDFSMVKRFCWRRLSPLGIGGHASDGVPKTLTCSNLVEMKIESLVWRKEHTCSRIPSFIAPNLRTLTLVALPGSQGFFKLEEMLHGNNWDSLTSVVLKANHHPDIPGDALTIKKRHLAQIGYAVRRLRVKGYIPGFVLGLRMNDMPGEYASLESLTVDLAFVKPDKNGIVLIFLPNEEFPVLHRLYLATTPARPQSDAEVISPPRIIRVLVPQSFQKLDASTVIEPDTLEVNGITLLTDRSKLIPYRSCNTRNRWVLEKSPSSGLRFEGTFFDPHLEESI